MVSSRVTHLTFTVGLLGTSCPFTSADHYTTVSSCLYMISSTYKDQSSLLLEFRGIHILDQSDSPCLLCRRRIRRAWSKSIYRHCSTSAIPSSGLQWHMGTSHQHCHQGVRLTRSPQKSSTLLPRLVQSAARLLARRKAWCSGLVMLAQEPYAGTKAFRESRRPV